MKNIEILKFVGGWDKLRLNNLYLQKTHDVVAPGAKNAFSKLVSTEIFLGIDQIPPELEQFNKAAAHCKHDFPTDLEAKFDH